MLERARKIEEKLIFWRREFHMHPELGFQETRTAARVAEEMEARRRPSARRLDAGTKRALEGTWTRWGKRGGRRSCRGTPRGFRCCLPGS